MSSSVTEGPTRICVRCRRRYRRTTGRIFRSLSPGDGDGHPCEHQRDNMDPGKNPWLKFVRPRARTCGFNNPPPPPPPPPTRFYSSDPIIGGGGGGRAEASTPRRTENDGVFFPSFPPQPPSRSRSRKSIRYCWPTKKARAREPRGDENPFRNTNKTPCLLRIKKS